MLELQGKTSGPYTFTEDTILRGMVTIEATVTSGATLVLYGMVTGDLIVEEGARAAIHGMVNGTVRNSGRVEVWGAIDEIVDITRAAVTVIHPNAYIKGQMELGRRQP